MWSKDTAKAVRTEGRDLPSMWPSGFLLSPLGETQDQAVSRRTELRLEQTTETKQDSTIKFPY